MSGVNNQIYQHLGNMENKEKFTEAKIKKFENELNEIKNEFANANPNARERLKEKAKQVIMQKKVYENDLTRIRMQCGNLKKTQHSLNQFQETVETIDLMQKSADTMKKMTSKIGNIDDLHEKMWDLNYELNEINDALSMNDYSVGEEIDDADLEQELSNMAGSNSIAAVDDSYLMDLDMELSVPTHKIGASSSSSSNSGGKGYKSSLSSEDRELEKALGL